MESVRGFGAATAGVAHDMRNVLNGLYLRLQVLERTPAAAAQPEIGQTLAQMRQDIQVGIQRVQSFARSESLTHVRSSAVDASAEKALRDANERLRESDRRKNEFLAMLSHELNNPRAPMTNQKLARLVDDLLAAAHSDGNGGGSEAHFEPVVTEPTKGPALARGRRVLVIEDDMDAAETLRDVIALAGHHAEVALTGAQGLARAREVHPDIVLCDIGLPKMDGFEVARAFRADDTLRDTFLVALSGYAAPEDVRRALASGFDRHLAKPPDLEKLEQLLAGDVKHMSDA